MLSLTHYAHNYMLTQQLGLGLPNILCSSCMIYITIELRMYIASYTEVYSVASY